MTNEATRVPDPEIISFFRSTIAFEVCMQKSLAKSSLPVFHKVTLLLPGRLLLHILLSLYENLVLPHPNSNDTSSTRPLDINEYTSIRIMIFSGISILKAFINGYHSADQGRGAELATRDIF